MARVAKHWPPSAEEQLDAAHREAIMLLMLRVWLLQRRGRSGDEKTDRKPDPRTHA